MQKMCIRSIVACLTVVALGHAHLAGAELTGNAHHLPYLEGAILMETANPPTPQLLIDLSGTNSLWRVTSIRQRLQRKNAEVRLFNIASGESMTLRPGETSNGVSVHLKADMESFSGAIRTLRFTDDIRTRGSRLPGRSGRD